MNKRQTRNIITQCRGHNSLRPVSNYVLRRGRNELWPLQFTYSTHFVMLCCVLLICILSLTACSTTPSSTNTSSQRTSTPTQTHLSPTPTMPPAGIVLYQADFLHGLPQWQDIHGLKATQGHLETTTGGPAIFTLPYKPIYANYALEFRIQIVRLINQNGGYFSLSAPELPGKNGYATGISDLKGTQPRPNGDHPSAQVSLKPLAAAVQGSGLPIDYEPHFDEHVYRIEVLDNQVSLFSDGTSLVSVSSSQTDTLSNGPISFKSDEVILRINSLRFVTI